MLGHTLSLCIPHWIQVDAIHYWPRIDIQGAQYININTNISTRVTHDSPNTTSETFQFHQLAPLHKSIYHAQDHSLIILQGTANNCLYFCAVWPASRASISKCSPPFTWTGSGGLVDEPPGMCPLKLGHMEDIVNAFEPSPELQSIDRLPYELHHHERSYKPSFELPSACQMKSLRRE